MPRLKWLMFQMPMSSPQRIRIFGLPLGMRFPPHHCAKIEIGLRLPPTGSNCESWTRYVSFRPCTTGRPRLSVGAAERSPHPVEYRVPPLAFRPRRQAVNRLRRGRGPHGRGLVQPCGPPAPPPAGSDERDQAGDEHRNGLGDRGSRRSGTQSSRCSSARRQAAGTAVIRHVTATASGICGNIRWTAAPAVAPMNSRGRSGRRSSRRRTPPPGRPSSRRR